MAVQTLPIDQPIDMLGNELRQAAIQVLAADPGSATLGQVYFNSVSSKIRVCTNATGPVFADVEASDATTGAKGIVQLAGDLAGTAALPVVAASAITLAKIAAAVTLDAIATGHATAADVDFNSHKTLNVSTPTARTDGSNKAYTDDTTFLHPVRVASASNVTIASPGASVDGTAMSAGQRVFLGNETTPSQEGIWVWNGAAVPMTRPADWATGTTRQAGELISVETGTSAGKLYQAGAGHVVDTGAPVWILALTNPGGSAAGDLTGTYPAPTIAAGAVTLAKLAAAVTLDAIATGHATAADVSLNTHKLIAVVDGTANTDAATWGQVQNLVNGLAWKNPVRVATTGSESYTIAAGSVTVITGTTIDGVSPAVGDRVLVKNAPASTGAGTPAGTGSSTQPANGIYKISNATTNLTMARDTDADAGLEVVNATVLVEDGSTSADFAYTQSVGSSASIPTVGTTALTFALIQSGSSVVGDNTFITRTANVMAPTAAAADPTAGSNGTVTPTAAYLPRIMKFVIVGDGSTPAYDCTHNFGTKMVHVTTQLDSTGAQNQTFKSWQPTTTNKITVTPGTVLPAAAKLWVTVVA